VRGVLLVASSRHCSAPSLDMSAPAGMLAAVARVNEWPRNFPFGQGRRGGSLACRAECSSKGPPMCQLGMSVSCNLAARHVNSSWGARQMDH
jgi:hypothetical protein